MAIEATVFKRAALKDKNEGFVAVDDVSFSKECKVDFTATLNPYPLTPTPPQGCQSGEFGFVFKKIIFFNEFLHYLLIRKRNSVTALVLSPAMEYFIQKKLGHGSHSEPYDGVLYSKETRSRLSF